MVRLDLHAPARKSAKALPAYGNVSRGYFPGRGLMYSLLVHEVVLLALVLVPWRPGRGQLLPERVAAARRTEPEVEILYLPALGSFDSPEAQPRAVEPRAGSSPARRGLSYPGPQPILSNPPDPTNSIQTLLQPALVDPPILKPPLSLPNIVQVAGESAAPLVEPPKPAVKAPEPPPEAPRVEADVKSIAALMTDVKTTLPVSSPELVLASVPAPENKGPAPRPRKPAPPEPPKPVEEPPRAPEIAQPARGKDLRDLVALSPMPAAPDPRILVPAGEARGAFAISPEPNVATTETRPGSKIEASPTGAALAVPGPPGPGVPAGRGASPAPAPSGGGASAGPRLTAPRSFGGITIVGGAGGNGNGNVHAAPAGSPPPVRIAPPPIHTSYGVTVLSTESTGGGLPSFGVFSQEQIYTVYLDMRRSPTDRTPSWTLEFAVLPGPAAAASAASSRQGLVLPFPAVKEPPAWPADVVRGYLRKLVIVYGQINTEGKLDQLSVKDSPDARLNQPVLDALQRWTFRPAQLNGAPVAVKVLLGIPIALSE